MSNIKDEFTTKELIELAEMLEKEVMGDNPQPKPRGPRENPYVLRFIREKNLQPGNNKVPTYIIYYYFSRWFSNLKRVKSPGHTEFFRTFSNYFTQKRTGTQRYYMINDVLEVNDDIINRAKNSKGRYAKKKKRKKQISRS